MADFSVFSLYALALYNKHIIVEERKTFLLSIKYMRLLLFLFPSKKKKECGYERKEEHDAVSPFTRCKFHRKKNRVIIIFIWRQNDGWRCKSRTAAVELINKYE